MGKRTMLGGDVPIVDACGTLPVHITRTDIRSGSLKNATECAAARALCRQTGCEEARVHLSRIYVKKDGTWTRYATPTSLRSEIIAFDRGGAFEPGEYVLTPVQPILRFGNPERREWIERNKNRKPKASHPQKGRRAKPHIVKGIRRAMEPW